MPIHHARTGPTTAHSARRVTRSRRAGVAVGAAALSASALFGLPASSAAAAEPTTSSPAAQSARPIAITVRAAEYHLDLPKRHFVPGTYVITVINSGSEPHALAVDGPDPGKVATPVLQPGESGQLRINMSEGRYEFYCPVGTHQQQGMGVTVTVS